MTEIIGLITGFFTFFSEVRWLIKTLQGTPEEHREALALTLEIEAEKFAESGRPTWD